jgi:hypothetical protein
MYANTQHQEVARDWDRHASFLDQDDDKAREHAVLFEEAR